MRTADTALLDTVTTYHFAHGKTLILSRTWDVPNNFCSPGAALNPSAGLATTSSNI